MTSVIKVDNIQNSSGTSALEIDSSGRVLTSNNRVFGQGSHGSQISATNPITLDTNRDSGGGVTFEDSYKDIKVPVAGLYMIHYNALGQTGGGAFQMHVEKNGTDIAGSYSQDTNSTNDNLSVTLVEVLAANDKIRFIVNSGASHGNQNYNNFFVVKIA